MVQMGDPNDREEINERLDNINESLSKIGDGFTRLADVAETLSERCIKRILNRRFIFSPSFWTAFIAVSGLMGLLLTWQQQVKAVEVSNIQRQLESIQGFKARENKAITKSRALLINQMISCPIQNNKTLKIFTQARVNSLINIAAYNSGLDISQNNKAKKVVQSIVSSIYSIKPDEICKMRPNINDRKLLDKQIQLNNIINETLKVKENKLHHIENDFSIF